MGMSSRKRICQHADVISRHTGTLLAKVELGVRNTLGREALVRYTIPVPVRGLRSAGVIGRETGVRGRELLCTGVRTDLGVGTGGGVGKCGAAILEPEMVLLLVDCGVCGVETIRLPVEVLSDDDGARRLLCDAFPLRVDVCGRRSGRGIVGWLWPIEALNDPIEDEDGVRALGKGSALLRFVLDGILLAEVDFFSRPCDHDGESSSPTGVSGIARLELDAVEGVIIPKSSFSLSVSASTLNSLIWTNGLPRAPAVDPELILPEGPGCIIDVPDVRDEDALLVLVLIQEVGGIGGRDSFELS